jgi:iron(III) transport system substrate-binding protein
MLRRVATLALAIAGIWAATAQPTAAQRTPIIAYTALETDQLGDFKAAIEAAVPEAEIQWVRDSTGVITARLLAEKDNAKADIILGLAASSVGLFKKNGMLEAYTPKGSDALRPVFRDAAPMSWIGMDAFLGVVCYNTAEGGKAGTTAPKKWADLLDPKFKDKIVMPHPASSGTGYLMVSAWLQSMGNEAGWKFMDGLHQNIAVYTHSGSAPCVQAAKGERLIGIGFDMRGAREKTAGAPIDLVLPTEGTGWEMEASAIVKGTKNLAIVQKIMDWVASKKANELYGKYYAIVAHPEVKAAPPNYPSNAEAAMIKMDLTVMGLERAAILAEWTKRYDAKAAPKK